MYSVQDPPCNMLDLSHCCWYDAQDEGVNIHLEDIAELVVLLPIIDRCGFHSPPVFKFVCLGKVPIFVSIELTATSLAVSDAAQEYGVESTHSICSELGTTRQRGSVGACGHI